MAGRRKSIFENVSDLAGLEREESEPPALDLSCKATTTASVFPHSPEKPSPSVFPPGGMMGIAGSGMLEQWALLSRMMELASAAQIHSASAWQRPMLWPQPSPVSPPQLAPQNQRRASSAGSAARSPEFPAIASAPNSNGTVLILADKAEAPAEAAASPAFSLPSHPPIIPPPPQSISPNSSTSRQPPRFQCPDCSRSYSTFSGLSKHRQFHCTSQLKRAFACKYCEKEYSSLGALKMHIRTHTLPCKCAVCGKAFSRPWLLQGHLRTHTGEKPFRCGHCGRSFADRSNLRAHLQTHSEVKKYRCGGCGKTFSRMSLLHKHEANGCPSALLRPS